MKGNHKRIVKNTIMLYVRILCAMFLSFYISRIVLQLLGVGNFGILSAVFGVTNLMMFVNVSLSGATSRFLTFELGKGTAGNLSKVFRSALFTHVVAAGIFVLLAETIGFWLVNHKLVLGPGKLTAANMLFQLGIGACVLSIIKIPYEAIVLAYERMNIFAYISILQYVLQLALFSLLFLFPKRNLLVDYGIMFLLVNAIVLLAYIFYDWKHFTETRGGPVYYKDITISIFGFCIKTLYSDGSHVFKMQGINILENMFFGPALSAATAVANQAYLGISSFADNFLVACRPQIVKNYATGDYQELQFLVINCAKLALGLLLLVLIPCIIETDFILKIWLKNPPEYATTFCRLLLIASYFSVLFRTLMFAVQATGNIGKMSFWFGSLYLLVVGIAYLYLKIGAGPTTPFWVNIVSPLGLCGIVMWLVSKQIPSLSMISYVREVVGKCALMACCGILPALWVYSCGPEGWRRLIGVMLVSTIGVSLSGFCGAMSRAQRRWLVSYIKRLIMQFNTKGVYGND